MFDRKSNQRFDILSRSDKGESSAGDHLARTYRSILADLRVDPFHWRMLMKQFTEDPANGIGATAKDRSTTAGNLHKALLGPRMTWKSFIRGLRLLSYVIPFIRIEVHYSKNGKHIYKRGFDVVNRLEGSAIDATHELENEEG